MKTTFLDVVSVHPALGVVACCMITLLGLFGLLTTHRICKMVERCKGRSKRSTPVVAEEPEQMESPIEIVPDREMELRSALKHLGYKSYEVDKVASKLNWREELPVLIKRALAELPNRAKAVQ